jgi:putative OPT family oligopeptide transporter
VCISAAIAGDASQDLKTGFLLGATPRLQQIGELIGVIAPATVMGSVLIVLNESYGIGTADGLPAPQATLMSLVIDGVLNASLPWGFVILGMAIAAVVEFVFKLPSLAFAVGLYLPVSLSTPIMIGGLLRMALTRKWEGVGAPAAAPAVRNKRGEDDEATGTVLAEKREQGVLFASGLIAGAALVGVLIGGLIYTVTRVTGSPDAADAWVIGHAWSQELVPGFAAFDPIFGALVFAALCWMLWRVANLELSNP